MSPLKEGLVLCPSQSDRILLISIHELPQSPIIRELDKKLREESFSVFMSCQATSAISEETVPLYGAGLEGLGGFLFP